MAVEMKTGLAGSRFTLNPGDVVESFTPEEEGRLIAKGYATAFDVEPEPPKSKADKGMITLRMVKTGEERKVSAAEAKRLIEAKEAVPVTAKDVRTAVVPESKIEQR